MNFNHLLITSLLLCALIVYLFANAPPPLTEPTSSGVAIPVERVFAVVDAENHAVRALWTKEIVGAGKPVGLKFDEHWRDPDVQAGPLPALFLRETARSLERDPVRLSLFLGSDYPINAANKFQGVQTEKYAMIKQTTQPQFFYATDTTLYTGMFPDRAVAQPCVDCHNNHPDTPKHDWQLNEIMGATTWCYPAAQVSSDELLQIVAALRRAFRDTYAGYLKKVETFSNPPPIGEHWPREGYYLPALEIFMAEVERRTAPGSLAALLAAIQPQPAAEPPRP